MQIHPNIYIPIYTSHVHRQTRHHVILIAIAVHLEGQFQGRHLDKQNNVGHKNGKTMNVCYKKSKNTSIKVVWGAQYMNR